MIIHHAHKVVTDDVFLMLDGFLPDSEVFLKLEGLNPAGSIKLKAAVGMVEDAERHGRLGPGSRLIESSSGSLGIALAIVAAGRGYSFTCVTDPNVSPQSLAAIKALGAHVVQVEKRDANGGYLGTRIAYIRERLAEDSGLVWLNQYANPANPSTHARTTASSVLRNIGRVDQLFVGAGTTGTLMGCVSHFRAHSPHTKITAVDAVGSVTFGGRPQPRRIPGLGTSRTPELCVPESVDEVIHVAEPDAVRMCRRIARERGLLTGGSTGSVLAALAQAAPFIPSGSRVVALSPDMGERYLQTIYHDDWVHETFGRHVLEPLDLDHLTVPA
ncbi:2,3-diaminopropionate biosynthesis protein SbnA [Streptomyces sp. WAC 01529]|uniref:2,3-diaminopropionate biosynthesis protein SbnA n=1 Tax=Streptomyces sp. WAC 01529 TaxID=2203205 RepID=UPI000F6DFF05|nr:2,3-diaminopropionate biosynthesis protein SbnA [Streptomyces sp. WAC 01529]AZM56022.1 2,3-diaminopropionate biosynthesis protein SbnA [Streptomyces sp. WAC 01529]